MPSWSVKSGAISRPDVVVVSPGAVVVVSPAAVVVVSEDPVVVVVTSSSPMADDVDVFSAVEAQADATRATTRASLSLFTPQNGRRTVVY